MISHNSPYDQIFSAGEHLVLELQCGDIFEGNFVAGGKDRIDLINTKQYNNPNEVLSGLYSFYRHEIKGIRKLKVNSEVRPLNSVPKNPNASELIDVDLKEYDRLKDLTKQFIYLENADARYYEAMKKLSEAETIGVASLGMEESKAAVVRLLAVCTWKQVYLFDLVNCKNRNVYPELKELLESEFVCKVIHGAGPLVEILFQNYKVFVRNVFDTQVVDLIIQNSRSAPLKELRSVSQCLTAYMNFPASFLGPALAVTWKQWLERPLRKEERTYAAQLVAYLISLKEKMDHVLLGKVYEAIDDVHDYYCGLSDYEFSQRMSDRKVPEAIGDLIPRIPGLDGHDSENRETKAAQ